MSSPRSRDLMNAMQNSQHEFRFTSQDGLPIACTRWQSRGPGPGARCRVPLGSNWKAFAPLSSATVKPACAISPKIFTKEGSKKCSMN